jgi:hypothetical protein
VSLRIPSSSRSPDHDPHRTIYYLGYPLGRFAGLKHRQLARQLVVDYFTYVVRPGASARRAARHAARRAALRRLLRLAQACRRLLCLRRASGCLGTSRGSSRGSSRRSSSTTPPRTGSSWTTSPTPCVRVPQHVARLVTRLIAPLVVDYSALRRLVVDYYASAARPGASARHTARLTARRRLLRVAQARLAACCTARRRQFRLHRAFGCLGTSRGPSRGSSSTTPCAVTSSCGHVGSTSSTSCVVTTCFVATLALLRVRRAPPRRRIPVASRRPFILTSFPN